MKNLFIIIFLFLSNSGFSQLKAVVIDYETKEKIPYVNIWVENENNGTSSNEKGEFLLTIDKPKFVIFSAIGYETKKIKSNFIHNIVELKPFKIELNEVVIYSKKQTKNLTIGKFKKSKINSYLGCSNEPCGYIARYFEYKPDYYLTPFLEKLIILTKNDIEEAKFNVRLYSVNEKGEPENYIFNKNIIGISKKGKQITEIDISDLNIKFPETGFFVAIEWLLIDNNKYANYTGEGSNRKANSISYEPSLGTVPAKINENSWFFSNGKWNKFSNNKGVGKFKNKYHQLAIELILSN